MGDGSKPKKKKNKILLFVLLLVVIIAITLLVIMLLPSQTPLSGLFGTRQPVFTVNELNFSVGRDRVFSHADGFVAAAGSLGLQVIAPDGRETLREPFQMSEPAITEAGGYFIAFDIGGSAVRVFNNSQILSTIEAEGDVVSASINSNGWFCIVTQERGGSRGIVTVYNNNGTEVLRAFVRLGFAVTARISPDNRSLAILSLTDTGSRISFYHGFDEDKDPDYLFDLSGELIIDIKYLSNTEILAISTDSLIIVDHTGNGRELFTFADKRLGAYIFGTEFAALHLYDYGIGYSGRVVTLSYDGTAIGELGLTRDIISMSQFARSLTVLSSDGLTFYDMNLEQSYTTDEGFFAANRVLALTENVVLTTSDHSASLVYRMH